MMQAACGSQAKTEPKGADSRVENVHCGFRLGFLKQFAICFEVVGSHTLNFRCTVDSDVQHVRQPRLAKNDNHTSHTCRAVMSEGLVFGIQGLGIPAAPS